MDTQNNLDVMARMKELVSILTIADEAYYQRDTQIMPDREYDKLADELALLEGTTGVVLAGSPSVRVGHSVLSALEKVPHRLPLLSLDKTKDVHKLIAFASAEKCLVSWKLDGLTVVANYAQGRLVQALTRGNGTAGEDITHNALVFRNIPYKIAHQGELSVRGEAIITFADFQRINDGLTIEADKYKNPRNLTSGTVRQLNSEVAAMRNVMYYAFALSAGDVLTDSKEEQLCFLQAQGFDIVPYAVTNAEDITYQVDKFKQALPSLPYATDGLVLTYDSLSYSRAMGQTSKFPHDSLAFKWADETAETTLIRVLWNTSRTGAINPVAVFQPVELEGSTVRQASLHNISVIEGLELGLGDRITVYKANMIIPQVAENLTKTGELSIPSYCPACNAHTRLVEENGVKTLFCPNSTCRAQLVRSLAHYVSRDAANIEGFSEATIEKLVEEGLLRSYVDIYGIHRHKDTIIAMEGFGERSFHKLTAAIEKSRSIELSSFINALGIPQIGIENAKQLASRFGSFDQLAAATAEHLLEIPGFGEKIAASVVTYFADENNQDHLSRLVPILLLIQPTPLEGAKLKNMTFVITGSLQIYANRKQLQSHIERHGGKIASTVSKQTTYLINNDDTSTSAKNKKARDLGIPIITESQFDALW